MTYITEVRFAHADGALAETLNAFPTLDVAVMSETGTDPTTHRYFFQFSAQPPTLEQTITDDHTVSVATQLPRDAQHVWTLEFSPEAELLAPVVTRQGGFVLDARSSTAREPPRGWHEYWVLPNREAVHEVWTHARAHDFTFELLSLNRRERQPMTETTLLHSDVLTEKQREALVSAYEAGYFAEPREASLEDVADQLGVSPAAVAGRLRRGTKALIGMALIDDR